MPTTECQWTITAGPIGLLVRGSLLGCIQWMVTAGCVNVQSPDPRVAFVAVGDSSTAGPSERDFIEYLPVLADEAAVRFANEGDGGATVSQVNERLFNRLEAELYPNARVVSYWAGGNDLIDFVRDRDPLLFFSPADVDYPFSSALMDQLDNIELEIRSALMRIRAANMTALIATYYPFPQLSLDCPALPFDVLTESQARHANAYVSLLNDRIRLAAITTGAELVDVAEFSDALLADPDNYFNCNHLSANGNRIVAEAMADVLASTAALADFNETQPRN